MRVKRGYVARRKRRKLLKAAKGYTGSRSKLFGVSARVAVIKAGKYAYRDRRLLKREMKNLWVIRINAAARENGYSYSQLINLFKKANIALNRKILADIAVTDSKTFSKLVESVKKA